MLQRRKHTWLAGRARESWTTFGIGGPVFIPKLFDGRNKLFWFVGGTNDSLTDANYARASSPHGSGAERRLPAICPLVLSQQWLRCSIQCRMWRRHSLLWSVSDLPIRTRSASWEGHPVRQPSCGNKVPASHLRNPTMAALVNSWLPTPTQFFCQLGNNFGYTAPSPSHFMQFHGARRDYAISDNDRVFFRFTRNTFTQALPGTSHPAASIRGRDRSGWKSRHWAGTTCSILRPTWMSLLQAAIWRPRITTTPGTRPSRPLRRVCQDIYRPMREPRQPFRSSCLAAMPMYKAARPERISRSLATRAQLSVVLSHRHCPSQSDARIWCAFVSGWRRVASTKLRSQQHEVPAPAYSTSTPAIPVRTTEPVMSCPQPIITGFRMLPFGWAFSRMRRQLKQATVSLSTPYYSAYVGDTWRVTPKLTFMPGVRFEEEYGPAGKRITSRVSSFDPNQSLAIAAPAIAAYASTLAGATAAQQAVMPSTIAVAAGGPLYAGVNGAPVRQWRADFRVLPRIGASYRLAQDTVIHGGYGLFFDTLNATGILRRLPVPRTRPTLRLRHPFRRRTQHLRTAGFRRKPLAGQSHAALEPISGAKWIQFCIGGRCWRRQS